MICTYSHTHTHLHTHIHVIHTRTHTHAHTGFRKGDENWILCRYMYMYILFSLYECSHSSVYNKLMVYSIYNYRHRWLHSMTDNPPTVEPPENRKFLIDHLENKSGTLDEYVPYSTTRPKIEQWQPNQHWILHCIIVT